MSHLLLLLVAYYSLGMRQNMRLCRDVIRINCYNLHFDNNYPSGMTEEFRVPSIKPERVSLLATDPSGKPFTIEFLRQVVTNATP